MGWWRIYSNKDNWLSTQVENDVQATGSNHGADAVLSVFSLKSNGYNEFGRILIQFPMTELSRKDIFG